MRMLLPLLMAALAAPGAQAAGFAVADLTTVQAAAKKALGAGFEGRAEPRRLTLACSACAGEPLIDLSLGRQDDGIEQRVRSGRTSIADLERSCRASSPTCRLTALDVAPAVGWVSSYPLGDSTGSTAIIIRDGDLLTIRSIAEDPAVARGGIDRLLAVVRSRLIGSSGATAKGKLHSASMEDRAMLR